MVAKLLIFIGTEYGILRDLRKSIEYKKSSLEVAIESKDSHMVPALFNRVGRAYKSAGQQETANEFFRQAADSSASWGRGASKG